MRQPKERFEIFPFVVLVALMLLIGSLLGPAIDAELAFNDSRIEAHKASLVSK